MGRRNSQEPDDQRGCNPSKHHGLLRGLGSKRGVTSSVLLARYTNTAITSWASSMPPAVSATAAYPLASAGRVQRTAGDLRPYRCQTSTPYRNSNSPVRPMPSVSRRPCEQRIRPRVRALAQAVDVGLERPPRGSPDSHTPRLRDTFLPADAVPVECAPQPKPSHSPSVQYFSLWHDRRPGRATFENLILFVAAASTAPLRSRTSSPASSSGACDHRARAISSRSGAFGYTSSKYRGQCGRRDDG
jgi:hypothetical protein